MARKDKAKKAAYERAWRVANPERRAAHLRKHKTGVTDEHYRAKLAEQDGRCAICGVNKCSRGYAMAADHCHATGKPRGVLCGNCNRGLGLLGDNAEGLRRAFAYLVRYETETKWQEDTNDENTIDTSATNHAPHI
jgi:hypothetical protein